MINILIVEDEAIVVRRVKRLLAETLTLPHKIHHKDTLDEAKE